MLTLFKNKNQEPASKREVTVTGALTDVLRPGLPAMYLPGCPAGRACPSTARRTGDRRISASP